MSPTADHDDCRFLSAIRRIAGIRPDPSVPTMSLDSKSPKAGSKISPTNSSGGLKPRRSKATTKESEDHPPFSSSSNRDRGASAPPPAGASLDEAFLARDVVDHPLVRDPGKGMNPINLATGMYGSRGERIRHVVHEGSLRLPVEALEILLSPEPHGVDPKKSLWTWSSDKKANPALKLPGLDSVVRPSIDESLGSITVSELRGVAVPEDPAAPVPITTIRTVATNRTATTPLGRVVLVSSANPLEDAERIRGGGEGEGGTPGQIPSGSTASVTASAGSSVGHSSVPTAPPPVAATGAVTLSASPPQATALSLSVGTPAVSSPQISMVPTPTQPPSSVSVPTHHSTSSSGAPSGGDPTPSTVSSTCSVANARPSAQPTVTVTTGARTVPAPLPVTSAAPLTAAATQVTVAPAPAKPASAPPPATVAAPPSGSPPAEQLVISLKKRPAPQWEQHIPGPNDEMQVDPANKTPFPEWYSPKAVSELEKTVLYEWFDGSAPHRTPATYLHARETIREMSDKLGNRYITTTMVRRAIPGDVSSLMRLHNFLTTYSIINEDAQNDSAPTPASLQDDKSKGGASSWSEDMRDRLLEAVVDQSRKRPKLDRPAEVAASAGLTIDWEGVAEQVGSGATAKECEQQFLALPLQPDTSSTVERSITPDASAAEPAQVEAPKAEAPHGNVVSCSDGLQKLIDGCDPYVACAITEAALQLSGGSLAQAQRAGVVGVLASRAADEAMAHEDSVAHLLSEIVDLRMKKLENRLTLLDDIEGMLEAERVALELERRDLYTARCRHWFGGP